MVMLLLALGCSVFADGEACTEGDAQGYTNGFNDGVGDCGYDDSVDPAILLDWPSGYESSSFTTCYKDGYGEGYTAGEVERDAGTTPAECD